MEAIYIIIFFILGIVLGSFYNVVGYRLSLNKSLVNPKNSYCPKCKKNIKKRDLIPILSYILLKGKCRFCKEKISIFYPLIELFTGLLFAVSFYSFGFSYDLLISLSLSSLLSIVIVSDLNFYIIPDQVTSFFGLFIVIINIFRFGFVDSLWYILYGLIMFLFMYLISIIGKILFKQEALGGGDIKLLFVLGMTIPLLESFLGIVLATLLAFPVSLYLLIRHKDKMIPFGPFLIIAFLLIFMFKIDIENIYLFLGLI